MMYARVRLPRQRWEIHFYIDTTPHDARRILQDIEDMGASGAVLRRAYRNLYARWKPDTGLTVSRARERRSVSVVSWQTSAREFLNTYAHELNHLEMHIGRAMRYDPYGEPASYLSGEINSRIITKILRL